MRPNGAFALFAATVLLVSCSSGSTDSGPSRTLTAPVPGSSASGLQVRVAHLQTVIQGLDRLDTRLAHEQQAVYDRGIATGQVARAEVKIARLSSRRDSALSRDQHLSSELHRLVRVLATPSPSAPQGYWIRFPSVAKPMPSGFGQQIEIDAETNLPTGTLAMMTGNTQDGFQRVQAGRIPIELTNPSCFAAVGGIGNASPATIKLVVAPISGSTQSPGPEIGFGALPREPANVRATLGPDFEHLQGAQVIEHNGVHELVATASYPWSKPQCGGPVPHFTLRCSDPLNLMGVGRASSRGLIFPPRPRKRSLSSRGRSPSRIGSFSYPSSAVSPQITACHRQRRC